MTFIQLIASVSNILKGTATEAQKKAFREYLDPSRIVYHLSAVAGSSPGINILRDADGNQLNIPDNSAGTVRGVVCFRNGNTLVKSWIVQAQVKKSTGPTLSVVGTPVITVVGEDAGMSGYILAVLTTQAPYQGLALTFKVTTAGEGKIDAYVDMTPFPN